MRAELYPITGVPSGRLAIMPRPRGGDWLEDEISSWKRSGLDTVVSLLTDSEIVELGLSEEPDCCNRTELHFIQYKVSDRGLPDSQEDWSKLVTELVAELQEGHSVGIHCRMGIGRSAILAVCVLAAIGVPVEVGWKLVAQARGMSVPDTVEQRQWVKEFVDRRNVL